MERFWVPHKEHVWLPCWLHHCGEKVDTLASDDGEFVEVPTGKLLEMAPVDPRQLEGLDDVCQLNVVTEGTLLHTIRVRFARQQIYTKVSNMLIAVNPFAQLPLYSSHVLDSYIAAADYSSKPPHIYSVGSNAIRGLEQGERDQAVVISGESGAGKTESAKLVMGYVAEARRLINQGTGLEEQIMRTNPVLEAFGNAMTVRNNNSSRFGKWLDFIFNDSGHLCGCSITHYLLEVTRVCSQAKGERSYHIFFQLIMSRDDNMLRPIGLQEPQHYRYLRTGELTVPGINDRESFAELKESLDALGFTKKEHLQICQCVGAVLNLGNVEFTGDKESLNLASEEPVQKTAELLEVEVQVLTKCLRFKTITVGTDMMESPLRVDQAAAVRDGFSRMLYGLLFAWLIVRMNSTLTIDGKKKSTISTGHAPRLLGILDIAGFESFAKNSLEQLLINLSNEHLQQHFNMSIFKSELDDYTKEHIILSDEVNFVDNSDVLDLIDGKNGLLDALDEECVLPKATDMTWVTKVLKMHNQHQRIVKPRFTGKPEFGVAHYAGSVHYTCEGFLEKNADEPPNEMLAILSSSKLQVVRELADIMKRMTAVGQATGGRSKKPKSATSRFRVSLRNLMEKIGQADPHFIRCIKPNKEKVPGCFASAMVMEQLILSGVLEAVRIRTQGYSARLPFKPFVLKYRCVVSSSEAKTNKSLAKETSELKAALAKSAGDPAWQYQQQAKALVEFIQKLLCLGKGTFQLGKTKLFMRAEANSVLESVRSRMYLAEVVKVQAFRRRQIARRRCHALVAIFDPLKTLLERCYPGSTNVLEDWRPGSLVTNLGSTEAAEKALTEMNGILKQFRHLDFRNKLLKRADEAQVKARAELLLIRELFNLKSCLEPTVIEKAAARARGLGLEHSTIPGLLQRAEALRIQLPLTEGLRAGQKSANVQQLQQVCSEVDRLGFASNPEKWIKELDAEALVKQARETLLKHASDQKDQQSKQKNPQSKQKDQKSQLKEQQNTNSVTNLGTPRPAESKVPLLTQPNLNYVDTNAAGSAAAAAANAAAAAATNPPTGNAPALKSFESSVPTKKRPTLSGLDVAHQTKLRNGLDQAVDEYDAVALENLLSEAARHGMLADMAAARQRLAQLQDPAFLTAAVAAAHEAAAEPNASKKILKRLQNLSYQIRILQVDDESANHARAAMQRSVSRSLRDRASKLHAASNYEGLDEIAQEAFKDLSEYRRLKSRSIWKGHRGTHANHVTSGHHHMLTHAKVTIAEALTHVPFTKEALAVQNFRDILCWMGDKPGQECQRFACQDSVINLARFDSQMRDEVFVQVMKQLVHNPSARSALFGWQLLLKLCLEVLPSDELTPFLRFFIHRGIKAGSKGRSPAAQQAADLAKRCLDGVVELEVAATEASSKNLAASDQNFCDVVAAVVHLVDSSSVQVWAPVTASLDELGKLLATKIGVKKASDFSFFQVLRSNDMPRLLPGHVKVEDLCKKWQELRDATKEVSFLHWRRRFLRCDEALRASDLGHAALTFRQALVMHLQRPAPPDDDSENIKKIAASILCAEFDTFPDDIDGILPQLMPAFALPKKTKTRAQLADVIRLMAKELQDKNGLGPTVHHFQRMSRTMYHLQRLRLFGSYHWAARQIVSAPQGQVVVASAPPASLPINPKEVESDVYLCVDILGIHFLPRGGTNVFWKTAGAKQWSFTYRSPSKELACGEAAPSFMIETDISEEGDGRLLRWGARPGLLQLVVMVMGSHGGTSAASHTPLLITLSCSHAMDAAYMIHCAITDGQTVGQPDNDAQVAADV